MYVTFQFSPVRTHNHPNNVLQPIHIMRTFIRTLSITFDTEIRHSEIPLFRGAVIKSLGEKANLLYHNHTEEDKFRYAYPLIQYKRWHGKAAIVCIEEGVELIGEVISKMPQTLILGKNEKKIHIEKVIPTRLLVQTWDSMFEYHIHNWLPLNSKNYQVYQMSTSTTERARLLEGILKGNLLSMLKGLGIFLDKEICLSISNLSEPHIIYNKGIGLMSFNVDFFCNLSIPNHLGIGKNASIGYGMIHQKKQRPQEETQ